MRAMGPLPIDAASSKRLKEWQLRVDSKDGSTDYASQLTRAQSHWERNRKELGDLIGETLKNLSSGFCIYCDCSEGGHIDHFRPKSWFPSETFNPNNFRLACDGCNRKKSSLFPIEDKGGVIHELGLRPKSKAPRKPPRGRALLMDPRTSRPADYFEIDFKDTFQVLPRKGLGPADQRMANKTLEVLDLNRDFLRNAREEATEHLRDAFMAFRCGRAPRLPHRLLSWRPELVWQVIKRREILQPGVLFGGLVPAACLR